MDEIVLVGVQQNSNRGPTEGNGRSCVAEAANEADGMTEEGVEREEDEASVATGEEEGMTEEGGERGESETWLATGVEEAGMTEEDGERGCLLNSKSCESRTSSGTSGEQISLSAQMGMGAHPLAQRQK
ncbi:hypothetical protein GPALN_003101 [Globodera pallida]|nr:hypothetical protein GPALN_003101 [Globodera pallida]